MSLVKSLWNYYFVNLKNSVNWIGIALSLKRLIVQFLFKRRINTINITVLLMYFCA